MPKKEQKTIEEAYNAQEHALFEEDPPEAVPPQDVFTFNELRSCADLVRLVDNGLLDIQPEFQRNVVWNDSQQSEFIDSLVNQLPIPSMCFSLNVGTEKRMVIDGLQRMSTIHRFLKKKDWKLKKTDSIMKQLSGKTVHEIEQSNPELFNRVQNTTIPVTIVRCDSNKNDHLEYLYMIFKRLNSGGVKLYNQEIRNCIFTGPLNSLLRELVKNDSWRRIYSVKKKKIDRMRDEELVLRFFAFVDSWEDYDGPLVKFLNNYMQKRRKISEAELVAKKNLFETVVEMVYKNLPEEVFADERDTIIEAALVGIALNIEKLKNSPAKKWIELYKQFRADLSVADEALKQGIMEKKKVVERMRASKQIFSV